jgi:hypothetical protein
MCFSSPCSWHVHAQVNYMKSVGMRRACEHRRKTRNMYILVSHERRDQFGDTDEDGRMILKWIWENGCNSFIIQPLTGHYYENSDCKNAREFLTELNQL